MILHTPVQGMTLSTKCYFFPNDLMQDTCSNEAYDLNQLAYLRLVL